LLLKYRAKKQAEERKKTVKNALKGMMHEGVSALAPSKTSC